MLSRATRPLTKGTDDDTTTTKGTTKSKATKGAKVTKVKSATKARTVKPTTGQSGPRLAMAPALMNTKERQLLAALRKTPTMTIAELAAVCFAGRSKAQRNSWVRNSLRRLVCSALVEKIDSGVYQLTSKGRQGALEGKGN